MEIISDAKRFFRYFLPGSVIILENVIVWNLFFSNFKLQYFRSNADTDTWIQLIVMYVVGSLSFGFLVSFIYHGICWATPLRKYFMSNHAYVINKLIKEGRIKTVPSLTDSQKITQQGAWRIATAIWYGKSNVYIPFQNASQRTKEFADIIGSLGTVYVGSVISFLVYFSIGLSLNNCSTFLILLFHWLFLLILMHRNFTQTIRHGCRTIDIIMYDELSKVDANRPIPVILVTEVDYEEILA